MGLMGALGVFMLGLFAGALTISTLWDAQRRALARMVRNIMLHHYHDPGVDAIMVDLEEHLLKNLDKVYNEH